jgi:hypothetical protein
MEANRSKSTVEIAAMSAILQLVDSMKRCSSLPSSESPGNAISRSCSSIFAYKIVNIREKLQFFFLILMLILTRTEISNRNIPFMRKKNKTKKRKAQ